jgi:ActR/RegA family two-component response regulator
VPKLVALDGDLSTLREIADAVGDHFVVVPCRDVLRAIGVIETDAAVRVVVTEHVMYAASGTSLLETVRARKPHVRRVMLTSYADLAAIVHGLHSGAIQHLVRKPIIRTELLTAVGIDAAATAAAARRLSA